MNTKSSATAALLLVCVAAGCARHVVRGSDYGVVAIPANSNRWPFRYREQAEAMMGDHFPGGYIVSHEQEVVSGQTTNAHARTLNPGGEGRGIVTTHVTKTTRDNTEWHIHYRRR